MDAANDAELRELRARAYGPRADITNDRAAMRRLRELEAARRAELSAATAPAGPPVGAEEPDAAPAEQLPTDAAPAVAARTGAPAADDGEPEWWQPGEEPDDDARVGATASVPRRRRVLWALSVIASAAVAAGVTYALTGVAPVSASSGVPQTTTLHPTTSTAVPQGFFGAAEDTPVYDFYGLTLFHAEGGFGGGGSGDTDVCIIAVATEEVPAVDSFDSTSWGVNGPIYNGCSAGAFPATIEVPLRSEAPETLRTRFPEARGVQFVLDGDRVGVFVDNGQTFG
ncbi:hypothetical protein [Microbacterium sp. NPDC087868]|uniref:hypothetical protein n=1 Tax=Microbacterium sp. NPDC087868 TaxID=3364195 RepID=UPI0038504277